MGEIKFEKENRDDAIIFTKKAIEVDRNHHHALARLAKYEQEDKKFAKALEYFARANQSAPT